MRKNLITWHECDTRAILIFLWPKFRRISDMEAVMDRRKFIQFGLAGTTGTLVAPRVILANTPDQMAGGVYHTSEAPGRWNKKVSSHLPNIEVEKQANGAKIQVFTRHELDDYEHYIIKHVILDSNYRFIDERMFIPGKDKEPLSEFTLEGYSGPIYALSACNQHDTWLNMAEI